LRAREGGKHKAIKIIGRSHKVSRNQSKEEKRWRGKERGRIDQGNLVVKVVNGGFPRMDQFD